MFAINTGKNVTSALPPSRYEVESKFKSIVDLSSKLEAQHGQAKSLRQLYGGQSLQLRQRLCDDIKVIFRFAPLEYGVRCEEILWKRNYYDYVKFFKKYAKQISPNDKAIFRMHIAAGIGHYQSLLFSFRKIFHLDFLDNILSYTLKKNASRSSSAITNRAIATFDDCKFVSSSDGDGDGDDLSVDENIEHIGSISDDDDDGDDEDQCGREFELEYAHDKRFFATLSFIVHRFCICLGDLARYFVDFFPLESAGSSEASSEKSQSHQNRSDHYYFNIASFYYKSASIIEPSLGMPYNQLGTLYSGSNCGIDSLYYYFRCLNSKKSFTGVRENMKQTFEMARKLLSLPAVNGATTASIGNPSSSSSRQRIQSAKAERKDPAKENILKIVILLAELFNLKEKISENSLPLKVKNLFTFSSDALSGIAHAFNHRSAPINSSSIPSTESLFKVLCIFAILIEQIKAALETNSIEIRFEHVKAIKCTDILIDNRQKGNFILFFAYRFIIQLFACLTRHEGHRLHREIRKLIIVNNATNGKSAESSENVLRRPATSSRSTESADGDDCMISSDSKNKQKKQKKKKKQKSKIGSTKSRKPILATSFSSDFNDIADDVVVKQLKSTALQTIGAVLGDHSDEEEEEEEEEEAEAEEEEEEEDENEMKEVEIEEEELNGGHNRVSSENENVSEMIDKLTFSDDDEEEEPNEDDYLKSSSSSGGAGGGDSSSIDQALRETPNSKTMDQLLAHIYHSSHTPAIKFFCDFLQSDRDFLQLLEHLDALSFFFDALFEYLNSVSEFDRKLTAHFSAYINSCLQQQQQQPQQQQQASKVQQKRQSLLDLAALIKRLSSVEPKSFVQSYPLSSELDYINITEEVSKYFDTFHQREKLPGNNQNHHHQQQQLPQQTIRANEQSGYVCVRAVLSFGVKIALLSEQLRFDNFAVKLENFDEKTVHRRGSKAAAKFVFNGKNGYAASATLSPFEISPPLPPPSTASASAAALPDSDHIPTGKIIVNGPLINFNDLNDNEDGATNATTTNNEHANFIIRPKIDKKKSSGANTTNSSNSSSNDYKSLYALSKLPFVLIDPYVYLEDLNFVQELVLQKKAFLVVPKLVTDFLDNLKEKNESAKEASIFLSNEFFRGSRMIRFIRNDDRLELELCKYPRYQWRRDTAASDDNRSTKKSAQQDSALFYELLEHCHYLLVNRVLEDRYQEMATIANGGGSGSGCESTNARITLITNKLPQSPANGSEIAKAYGIELETTQSFTEKLARIGKNSNNRMNGGGGGKGGRKLFRSQHVQSPMYFVPIPGSMT